MADLMDGKYNVHVCKYDTIQIGYLLLLPHYFKTVILLC